MSRARLAVRRWWDGASGVAGEASRAALWPAELLYRSVVGARNLAYDRGWLRSASAPMAVISVGNVTVGGTGKTPVTSWLVGQMLEEGFNPAVLHGGYAPDEPALHGRWYPSTPVIVGRDRVASTVAAADRGAEVVLLDDGFQHRRLGRDADLVLIAAERWTEPVRLLPRGPWREPPSALRRADAILVTRKTASADRALNVAHAVASLAPGVAVGVVAIRPAAWVPPSRMAAALVPDGPVVAVAAIAEPELFLANVEETGVLVAEHVWYGDHHRYSAADAKAIATLAAGRPVVTTMKDAVKLETLEPRLEPWVLEQHVTPEHGAHAILKLVIDLVRHRLSAARSGRPPTGT